MDGGLLPEYDTSYKTVCPVIHKVAITGIRFNPMSPENFLGVMHFANPCIATIGASNI